MRANFFTEGAVIDVRHDKAAEHEKHIDSEVALADEIAVRREVQVRKVLSGSAIMLENDPKRGDAA